MKSWINRLQAMSLVGVAVATMCAAGCGGSGLTEVTEGMSQEEMDAYMEGSRKMSEMISEAEKIKGSDG